MIIDGLEINDWSRSVVEQVRSGGVDVVHATCGVWEDMAGTMTRIGSWRHFARQNSDVVRIVTDVAGMEQAVADDVLGIVLGFQNSSMLGDDPEMAGIFADVGVRVIQLTYNIANHLGSGICGGLGGIGLGEDSHADRFACAMGQHRHATQLLVGMPRIREGPQVQFHCFVEFGGGALLGQVHCFRGLIGSVLVYLLGGGVVSLTVLGHPYPSISTPMLRAVPSIIFMAASTVAALRSFCLVSAIWRTAERDTVPTLSWRGCSLPLVTPSAFRMSSEAGGVLVMNVNEVSSKIVISTWMMVPD